MNWLNRADKGCRRSSEEEGSSGPSFGGGAVCLAGSSAEADDVLSSESDLGSGRLES